MYPEIPKALSLSYRDRQQGLDPKVFAILGFYLEVYGQFHLYAPVRSIATELLNNAFKANLKRLFFETEKLDFQKDYAEGQRRFVGTLHTKPKALEKIAAQQKRQVCFCLEPYQDFFMIKIKNEAPLHAEELDSIQHILQGKPGSARKRSKQKEGGGMGLQMVVSLVCNLGLPKDSFVLEQQDGWTIFVLKLPRPLPVEGQCSKDLPPLLKKFFPELPTKIEGNHSLSDSTAELLNAALLPQNSDCKHPSELKTKHNKSTPRLVYPEYAKGFFEHNKIAPAKIKDWAAFLEPDLDPAQLSDRLQMLFLSRRLPHALTKQRIRKIQRCIGQTALDGLRYEATGLRIAHPDFLACWAMGRISPALWEFWFGNDGTNDLPVLTRILEILWYCQEGHPPRHIDWKLYLEFLTQNKQLNKKKAQKILELLDSTGEGFTQEGPGKQEDKPW